MKIIFYAKNKHSEEYQQHVGNLLYVGVETVLANQSKSSNTTVNIVVFVALDTLTGDVYKIYDENNIRIYKNEEKTDEAL